MNCIKLIPICLIIFGCSESKQKQPLKVEGAETLVSNQKRLPPKSVSPVIVDKIKYVSSLNEIIAIDIESQKELWRKEIYEISYDESLERDVQDIFIDSIMLFNNSLVIRNESNELYFLGLDLKKIYPNHTEIEKHEHQGYDLYFSESYKTEFEYFKSLDSHTEQLNKSECIERELLSELSNQSLDLKLNNGQFHNLRKPIEDEQFYGYSFEHFDPTTNLYVVWENWLEAGHPIAIDARNGNELVLFGKNFSTNLSASSTVNFAIDLGAGWTPNGIQFLNIDEGQIKKLFEFDPIDLLSKNWGPLDVAWKNDSTVIIHFTDAKSSSIYMQMKFKNQTN
ncbi:hypothetical protein [Flavobacterium okayamense]|uniref:TolB-like 6-blade propeller-like n=1 Tax=Flavobacterium okayamense TaxID=2830782 RepID=A0ABM7SC12_9FLAO|nr:hypothetical protein [Flavobacterium okayamense]BCY28779.1 hypothetical protein KK2020170_16470 [Flavobacterium okayamense]